MQRFILTLLCALLNACVGHDLVEERDIIAAPTYVSEHAIDVTDTHVTCYQPHIKDTP